MGPVMDPSSLFYVYRLAPFPLAGGGGGTRLGTTVPAAAKPPRPRRRWAWIFLGGCCIGFVLTVAVLHVPAVQGWIVRKAVETQPGWQVNFEKFGAGLGGVKVQGLTFKIPGVSARSEPIVVQLAPGRLLNSRELRVQRIEARKLLVTLTPAEFAATSGTKEAFSGVLKMLQLPLRWALVDANIDGEIAVRDGTSALVVGAFTLRGGGLSSESPGEFRYELEVNSSLLPQGPENKVRSRGTIRLKQAPDNGIALVEIAGDFELPRYGALALPPGKFSLALTDTDKGEDYRARWELGQSGTLEFTGGFEAARALLTGKATAKIESALVASLAGGKVPDAVATGVTDITFDAQRGDLDVTLKGDLAAKDWGRIAPQLATLEPFAGTLQAALTRRGGKLSLQRGEAVLRSETGASLRLAQARPVDPLALPATLVATLTLEKVPLAWANPWLAGSDVALDPATLQGAWQVALSSGRDEVRLTPSEPLRIGPLRVTGPRLPPMLPLTVTLSPRVALSWARLGLEVDDLLVTSERGDRVGARFTATCDHAANLALAGELTGQVPTLLSGPERPLPFALAARWDLALAGSELRAKVLEITACPAPTDAPNFSLELLRPTTLDLKKLAVPPATAQTDWARLRFSGLPLGWLSRWTPGREIAGTVAAGESVLRSTPEGMLSFATTEPWTVNDAAVIVGGKTFFSGMARIAPDLAMQAGRYTAAVREIVAKDKNGNRIQGSITAEATQDDRKAKTTIALDAELPALPHAAETFGTVQVALRATSHNESNRVVVVDEFALQVRAADRELFALISPEPFYVGLSDSGTVNFGTLSSLKLVTGEIPVAWLQPWIPTMTLSGMAQPTEFLLTAQRTKFLVRPVRPVQVRDFSATFAGRPIASEMEFSVYPGLDLTAMCKLEPEFKFIFNGALHLTNGAVNVGGRRAVDIDASFAFAGDEDKVLPAGMEYTSRADFTELGRVPALAGTGLPARGSVVIRANGDMLGKTPLELWMRFEGLPDDKDTRILPALEITGRGRMSEQGRLLARMMVRLETQPRASDAQFDARLDPASGQLEVASRLRSEFVDVTEVMAFVDAAQGRRAVKVGKPDDNQPDTYPQLGQPVWANLRGRFELDLGTVSYAPYRVEQVKGRLELKERELTLTNLSGAMFAGRWSGQARIDYQPEDKKADHALSGDFKIEQFDSARVVQAVFPTEMASVEAKIDVEAKFRGRGNALPQLFGRAEVDFSAESRQGVVRLAVPKQDFAASAALVGGTLLLSPELRALGRLLQKFAEMPVDRLKISGMRYEGGTVELSEFRLDSPQARLLAQGSIPAVENEPLMNCPLFLTVDLAAKDEMAVILGGMSLIEKKPREDGYRALKEKFEMRGKAGEPDTRPLYDLLAKAVLGSKGTWGFLMRKVEEQVKKPKPADPKKSAEPKKTASAP